VRKQRDKIEATTSHPKSRPSGKRRRNPLGPRTFLCALTGIKKLYSETDLLCRPTRDLGLEINDPVKTASNQFTVSKIATSFLTQTITTGTLLDISLHEASLRNGANEKLILEKQLQTDTLALIESFDDSRKRSLVRN